MRSRLPWPTARLTAHASLLCSAPANLSAFSAAIDYYGAHGCSMDRMAVGLLTDEVSGASDAYALADAARRAGVRELDLWANLWTSGCS